MKAYECTVVNCFFTLIFVYIQLSGQRDIEYTFIKGQKRIMKEERIIWGWGGDGRVEKKT